MPEAFSPALQLLLSLIPAAAVAYLLWTAWLAAGWKAVALSAAAAAVCCLAASAVLRRRADHETDRETVPPPLPG